MSVKRGKYTISLFCFPLKYGNISRIDNDEASCLQGGFDMKMVSLEQELSSTSYPGRGIVIGKSEDGKCAVTAYFIMGRSENSRNRIFVEDGEGIRTQAFDPSKLEDPSLIIYAPVRVLGNKTIVTHGDQTDTIYEGMDKQLTFEQSLRCREFEPDAPNYTPRISGIMHKRSLSKAYNSSLPFNMFSISNVKMSTKNSSE